MWNKLKKGIGRSFAAVQSFFNTLFETGSLNQSMQAGRNSFNFQSDNVSSKAKGASGMLESGVQNLAKAASTVFNPLFSKQKPSKEGPEKEREKELRERALAKLAVKRNARREVGNKRREDLREKYKIGQGAQGIVRQK